MLFTARMRMRHTSVRRIIMITKYNLITYLSISVINAFQMRLSEIFMLLLFV